MMKGLKAWWGALQGRSSQAGIDGIPWHEKPLLVSRTPLNRSRALTAMLLLGFLIVAGYAINTQLVNRQWYLEESMQRTHKTHAILAKRGLIRDRNGSVLASNQPAIAIQVQPALLYKIIERKTAERDAWLKKNETSKAEAVAIPDMEALYVLGKRLGMHLDRLEKLLTESPKDGKLHSFYMAHGLDEAAVRELFEQPWLKKAHLLNQGVSIQPEYVRQYHETSVMSRLIGQVDSTTGEIGTSGLELGLNELLKKRSDGSQLHFRVGNKRVVDVLEERPPEHGRDVYLSIDSQIQYQVWRVLRDAVKQQQAKSGSVVVLDAHTGGVLALADYDTSNNSTFAFPSLQRAAELGSVVKPLVVAGMLQAGAVRPTTSVNTGKTGVMQRSGVLIKDAAGYGTLTVSGVLEKSSNIGMALLGDKIDRSRMRANLEQLGMGQAPQLPLAHLAQGKLRSYASWANVDKDSITRGYGISASLYQVTRAYLAFANDGVLPPATIVQGCAVMGTEEPASPPSLQDCLVMDDKNKSLAVPSLAEQAVVRVYSPEVARQMRAMLHRVTLPGNTGQRAQTAGYLVGGKTGTARKLVPVQGAAERTKQTDGKPPKPKYVYSTTQYLASFVGMAPIGKPRIVVGVMLDEPVERSGGRAAAPVFSQVVHKTLHALGVVPDVSVQPQITVDPIEESGAPEESVNE